MVGDDRRVDNRCRSCTKGIRKSRTLRVPRCKNIVHDEHDDFSYDHRMVTWGVAWGWYRHPAAHWPVEWPRLGCRWIPEVQVCMDQEPVDVTLF